MKIYAISDFHLSNGTDKPMDVFGDNWKGHWDKIREFCSEDITSEDIILSAGDTSWGMSIAEALPDLTAVDSLPGTKFIIRGNHDYWWSSYKKINSLGLAGIRFIQNNAFKVENFVLCGTRGWTVPDRDTYDADKKIFDRELIRLKLTLEEGAKLRSDGDRLLLLTHYPPFNSRYEDSSFTDMIADYRVEKVVYGHLHGCRSRCCGSVFKGDTEYLLTSCDFLSFRPLRIY